MGMHRIFDFQLSSSAYELVMVIFTKKKKRGSKFYSTTQAMAILKFGPHFYTICVWNVLSIILFFCFNLKLEVPINQGWIGAKVTIDKFETHDIDDTTLIYFF